MTKQTRQLEQEIRELRNRLNRLEDRPSIVQPPKYTRLAQTVKDPVGATYPDQPANTFWIVFLDGSFTVDSDAELTPTYDERQVVTDAKKTAHNIANEWVPEGTIVSVTFQPGIGTAGQWWFDSGQAELQKFQIDGNHPGKGVVFNCWLGTWDPATHKYIYDCGTTFKGIDNYNGVPFPTNYPQGHGIWKPSDTHTKIIDVVTMDCTGPGIDCPA